MDWNVLLDENGMSFICGDDQDQAIRYTCTRSLQYGVCLSQHIAIMIQRQANEEDAW